MTSLRTFQNEIDEIQHREALMQKAIAHVASEKEKEAKRSTATTTKEVKADVSNEPNTITSEAEVIAGGDEPELAAVELKIQVRNKLRTVVLYHHNWFMTI